MPVNSQRKLTAIVSADVVGYSRLMGIDEAGTHARLKSLYLELVEPKITEHGGRVVKLMGDGLLGEFSSVVDAVNWAVEIQTKIAESYTDEPDDLEIEYRIGVNLGDVIVDGDDIFGDGVNVASRLQEISETGGICISEKVYAEVLGKLDIEFADGGVRSVKNIAQPIQVWRWSPAAKPAATRREFENDKGSQLADRPSIAVLPFDNMSGDPEQEYFSDGISEDIITDLSKISALFVIARNSSFTYKGQAINIQQVSRDLGVRYVVEGSVRKAGNRARITAQLIDAHTGGHVWADRYDRELADIFAVQDEITSEIVNALQLVLLPNEMERVARAPTSDFQAYDYYLKGRQCFHPYSEDKIIEAQQWFERAIECDPGFARAYCGLADCGSLLYSNYGGHRENLDRALEAVSRALDLEPDLAEAHSSMGLVLSGSMGLALSGKGEKRDAEEEFAKAIELDPDLYEAHNYWARYCFEQGNLEEAAKHFEQAWRVSPRDPHTPSLLLGIYRDLNRKEDVETVALKTLKTGLRKLEVEPNDTVACLSSAFALIHLDRYPEAVSMMDRAFEIDPSDRIIQYNLACAYAIMGETDKALDFLEEMSGTSLRNFDWMENDGDLDSLRDHPRFKKIMQRLGASKTDS
jgi:adenylate cyclase